MAQMALSATDERTKALRDTMTVLLGMEAPRKLIAGMVSGLDIRYDVGDGHRCSGAACPISTWSLPAAPFACLPCCTTPGPCSSTSANPADSM